MLNVSYVTFQGMKMNPLQSLYYVSPACAVALLVPFVIVELPQIVNDENLIVRPFILLLNAIVAFALNLAGL